LSKTIVLPIVISAIGEPLVEWVGVRILDKTTGTWYNVYPEGQAAKCTPGAGNLVVSYGVRNVGAVDGNVYGRILGPAGEVLSTGAPQWCRAGEFVYWEPILDMPAGTLNIELQASTSSAFVGAAVAKLGIAAEGDLFSQFWAQFVAFLTGLGVPADMIPPKPPVPALPV